MTILTKQDKRYILIPAGDGKEGHSLRRKKELERLLLNFQEKLIITNLPKLRAIIKQYIILNKYDNDVIECYPREGRGLVMVTFPEDPSDEFRVPYKLLYKMYKEYYLMECLGFGKFRVEPKRILENDLIAYNLFMNLTEIHENFDFRMVFSMCFQKCYLGYTMKSEALLKSFIWSKDKIVSMEVPSIVEDRVYRAVMEAFLNYNLSVKITRLINIGDTSNSIYKKMFFALDLDKKPIKKITDIEIVSESDSELRLEFNGKFFDVL